MKDLIAKVSRDFSQKFGQEPEVFSQAPGRINIIGEHTDYTGGVSLPAAIDYWTVCAWRKRTDQSLRIYAENMDDCWETSWPNLGREFDRSWKKYVAGAMQLFQEASGQTLVGLEVAILGNVPLGKGLSSSASVELAVLNGLSRLYGIHPSPLELAKMAQQVEHRYLKVKSGLLDQFASQFSKENSALLIDFMTYETRPAPAGREFADYSWVLVDSLVKRELSNSKYSERVEEFLSMKPSLDAAGKKTIRDVRSHEVSEIFKNQPENIVRRAKHIVSENERTFQTFDLLQKGDVKAVGSLLLETHRSLARDYEVSHRNLDFLVDASREIPGVMGGRMMGGGFGGTCIFLVASAATEKFSEEIMTKYLKFSGLKTDPRAVKFVGGANAWSANSHGDS